MFQSRDTMNPSTSEPNPGQAQMEARILESMNNMRKELEQSFQMDLQRGISSEVQQVMNQYQNTNPVHLQLSVMSRYHQASSSNLHSPTYTNPLFTHPTYTNSSYINPTYINPVTNPYPKTTVPSPFTSPPTPIPDLPPPTMFSTQHQLLYHQHTSFPSLQATVLPPNNTTNHHFYPEYPNGQTLPYYAEHSIEAQTLSYHVHAPSLPCFQLPPIIVSDPIQADCGQNWEARYVFEEMPKKVVETMWYQTPPPNEEEIGLPSVHFEEDDEIEILWLEPPSPTTAMSKLIASGMSSKILKEALPQQKEAQGEVVEEQHPNSLLFATAAEEEPLKDEEEDVEKLLDCSSGHHPTPTINGILLEHEYSELESSMDKFNNDTQQGDIDELQQQSTAEILVPSSKICAVIESVRDGEVMHGRTEKYGLTRSLLILCSSEDSLWCALQGREGVQLLISLLGFSSEQQQECPVALLCLLSNEEDERNNEAYELICEELQVMETMKVDKIIEENLEALTAKVSQFLDNLIVDTFPLRPVPKPTYSLDEAKNYSNGTLKEEVEDSKVNSLLNQSSPDNSSSLVDERAIANAGGPLLEKKSGFMNEIVTVTFEEFGTNQFMGWLHKPLSYSQSPASSSVVKFALGISVPNLFTKLIEFVGVKKEGICYVGKVVQPLLKLLKMAGVEKSMVLNFQKSVLSCDFLIRADNTCKDLVNLTSPRCILDEHLMKIWYKLDNIFKLPEANAYFRITLKGGFDTVKSCLLTELFISLLKDKLNEIVCQACVAKLETSVSSLSDKLELKVYGFNGKLPVLLSKVLAIVTSFSPTDDSFKVIKEDMERTLKNANMKRLSHSSYVRLQILREHFWNVDEKLGVLKELSLADLKASSPILLSQLYIDGPCYGNLLQKEAIQLLCHILGLFPPYGRLHSGNTKATCALVYFNPFLHRRVDVLEAWTQLTQAVSWSWWLILKSSLFKGFHEDMHLGCKLGSFFLESKLEDKLDFKGDGMMSSGVRMSQVFLLSLLVLLLVKETRDLHVTY